MKSIPVFISIFVISITMLVILVFSQTEIMKEKVSSMEEFYQSKARKLSTDFEITKVEYNDKLNITIMNIGSEKLDPKKIQSFIPTLINSSTIIDEGFNLINSLYFDPGEKAYVIIEKEINSDENYTLSITSENAISKKINFILENKKLDIISASSSDNNNIIEEINESDSIETSIEIETDSYSYLWINYSIEDYSIQDSFIYIEHYFNDTNNVTAYLEYEKKDGWTSIDQLSNFNLMNEDIFYFEEEASNFRIKYYSNNKNLITSNIDKFEIVSNITRWWDIS
jgi:hypothetical protein